MNLLDKIHAAIRSATQAAKIEGKCGRKLLQPLIAQELKRIGLEADMEDTRGLLPAGFPVWRDKTTGQIEVPRERRKIDIVVYQGPDLIAFVETESDLNDLRESEVTRRNGHYDVFSIARSAAGTHFHSYKSLERMAAAALYIHQSRSSMATVESLTRIRSDDPLEHNPEKVGLFLVSGVCRSPDKGAF